MVDEVDELIVSALSQNSKQSSFEIWDFLRNHGISLTEDEIDSRITRLEEEDVIKYYTVAVNTKKLRRRVIRVDLVTFRPSQALPKRLEGLKKYLSDAPFVLFSGRTRGGYDWITIKSFFSEEMADEENDIYKNLFGDIIQTFEEYDFVPQKDSSFYALTYTEKEYKHFLKEWMPPFVGR